MSIQDAPLQNPLTTHAWGKDLKNPFIMASATLSGSQPQIERAFEAGFAGVVTKTIAFEGAQNVKGGLWAMKYPNGSGKAESPADFPIAGWNCESISTRPMDEWFGIIERVKTNFPDEVVIASIMAGDEIEEWQELARNVISAGADAIELNGSCPHMFKGGMGHTMGRQHDLVSEVIRGVKEAVNVPVSMKPPSDTDPVESANAAFRGGADMISTANTFSALPFRDPNDPKKFFPLKRKDGLICTGGLSGQAIYETSLARLMRMADAHPDKEFCGIGGINTADDALGYLQGGASSVQLFTVAMHYVKHFGGQQEGLKKLIQDLSHGLQARIEDDLEAKNVFDVVGQNHGRIQPIEKLL